MTVYCFTVSSDERLGYDINIEAGGVVNLIIIIKKGVETNYNEY